MRSPPFRRVSAGALTSRQPIVDRFQIEEAFAAGQKAFIGVLGILLLRQPAKVPMDLPPVPDLFRFQLRLCHQLPFDLRHLFLLHRLTHIRRLQPPRKKMLHRLRLLRLLPLLQEAAAGAVGRRLHRQLPLRRKRRHQPVQNLRRIARPPCQFRAVQVRDRQPSPCVAITRRFHQVFAVHLRKNDPPRVSPCPLQGSFPPRLRQMIEEAVHDAKDLLGRLLRMRHLHRHRSRVQDGFQEKPARNPRRHPHLPRLQHDVSLAHLAVVPLLRLVSGQAHVPAQPVSDFQNLLRQLQSRCAASVQRLAPKQTRFSCVPVPRSNSMIGPDH